MSRALDDAMNRALDRALGDALDRWLDDEISGRSAFLTAGNLVRSYTGMRTAMHAAVVGALAAECPAPRTILDLGGCDGLLAVRLRERFPAARIVSADINPVVTRRAAGLTQSGRAARYAVADVQALPFGDGAFPAVVTSAIACWVVAPGGAWAQEAGLRECARVLAPGGVLVALAHGVEQPGMCREMPGLDRLVAAAGLRVRSAGGIGEVAEPGPLPAGAGPHQTATWAAATRAARGRSVLVTARKPGRRRP